MQFPLARSLGPLGRPRAAPAGFSPADIAGLQLWLRADSLSLADGAAVSSWPDSSGNGNAATAATTARPAFWSAVANGRPVLRFDGVGNYLTVADVPALRITGDLSLFVVQKLADFSTYDFFVAKLAGNGGTGENEYEFRSQPGGDINLLPSAGPSSAALPAGAFSIAEAVRSAGTASYFIGGAAAGSAASAVGVAGTNPVLIGTRDDRFTYLSGDVAEIVLYNSALGSTDRGKVESYLKTKYGL